MSGRKPDLNMVKKVAAYRRQKPPLSIRNIARLLTRPEKKVHARQVQRYILYIDQYEV